MKTVTAGPLYETKLSEPMIRKLCDIGRVPGTRKLVCQGSSSTASLRALARRNLITLRYISSRAYDAALTPEGRVIYESVKPK